MDYVYNLIVDLLNGFSLRDIPLFLIQIYTAAFLVFIAKKWLKNSNDSVLFTAIITAIVIFIKYSIPISIIAAGGLFWFKISQGDKLNKANLKESIIIFISAIGCGTGSVIFTIIFFVFFVYPYLFFYRNEEI